MTTDNASNNATFLQAVEIDLSKSYIQFNSGDQHVRCLAHVINLAAQQVLNTLKAVDDNESSNEGSGRTGSLIHKVIILFFFYFI